MYRITYEQGNGYRCSCCSSWHTATEDFETEEEVLHWLKHTKDDPDIDFENVIVGEDITGEILLKQREAENE